MDDVGLAGQPLLAGVRLGREGIRLLDKRTFSGGR